MIRNDHAPVPNVVSDRKLGLEIEIDLGHHGDLSDLPDIQGWIKKSDGSLDHGHEYTFNGPVTPGTSKERCERFCKSVLDVNVHKKGGFHVHVQGSNYTHEDCFNLCRIYTKFQHVIDKLVAPSRVGNTYCQPYSLSTLENHTVESFARAYHLTPLCSDRGSAKNCTNRYRTVNTNMMCCREENQRSIEFRQGSVSKRFSVVYGWPCFLVALVEIAKVEDVFAETMGKRTVNLQDLLTMIHKWEVLSGSTDVANWVEWRYNYLNQKPDDAELRLALEAIAEAPVGLYGLSRKIDINLAVTKRIIDDLLAKGLIFKKASGTAYITSYEFKAEADLKKMVEALVSRNESLGRATAEANRLMTQAGLGSLPMENNTQI